MFAGRPEGEAERGKLFPRNGGPRFFRHGRAVPVAQKQFQRSCPGDGEFHFRLHVFSRSGDHRILQAVQRDAGRRNCADRMREHRNAPRRERPRFFGDGAAFLLKIAEQMDRPAAVGAD
ncbi:hypothetical protein SDC9_148923 [bioreactor metagenome]|uniref:Uncharacterized protein n=1 Tax=bioreactor metagenome TaxID=1076179 RepID=A0A645EKB0_9ZZZZ